MKDIPTPIADGIWNKHSGEGDDYSYELYEVLQLMEQRLSIAVAALKFYAKYAGAGHVAQEALAQIEEKDMTTEPSFFVITQERDEAMRRLAIAVTALQSIREYWRYARTMTDACEHNRNAAADALARIKEEKK